MKIAVGTTRRISLRWRLTLIAWFLVLGTAFVLIVLLHLRTRRQLLQQLEKNLETRCDEVIMVLEGGVSTLTLDQFLIIETRPRQLPYTYFYDIRDAEGRVLGRSRNLGKSELPLPAGWGPADGDAAVRFRTEPDPTSPSGDWIRIRSERVRIAPRVRDPFVVVIQTAVTLGPYDTTVRRTLRDAVLVASGSLSGVLFLLWFVTTRALRPVAAMTREASKINASNLRERLPLAGRRDELDQLAQVLNDMLDRLGASLRQMEQFSSDAAHQLRTPLTRIRGELDLVLRGELSDDSRSQLERVQEEAEHMSRLCGRLLLLARLDQQSRAVGGFDDWVDLDELVSDVTDRVTPVAQDRGIDLRRGAASDASVRGNRPLLVEALLNLLDNAIRFTPQGAAVIVSTSVDNGSVRLSVEDSGPGIPPEERERVFQRFYRCPRGTTTEDGNGLGLPIVMGIAQAHGGRVELAEARCGGSLFHLVLPRRRA